MENLKILILNMALNLRLYVMQKNYNFDNPNYPPIFAFTPNINEISNNENDFFGNV
jgi:hypothetical protein